MDDPCFGRSSELDTGTVCTHGGGIGPLVVRGCNTSKKDLENRGPKPARGKLGPLAAAAAAAAASLHRQ